MSSSIPAIPAIPDEWFCPISRELMTDPVIGSDGVTYNRPNIERWLASNPISPMTREPMPPGSLIPNMALRHTIAGYLSANPERIGQITAPPLAVSPAFRKHALDISASVIGNTLQIRLLPPRSAPRQPICFIAILDNSGSMSESASMAAGTETFGFTRMDLTKHAANTVLEMMTPEDTFGLVTFSTEAKVVLSPTLVTASNKARIKAAINSIEPDANTNIYDGIRKAAIMANHPDMAGRHIVALMMTDGYPNLNPPRGIVPTLANMRMTNPWTLHTFGFGYNLDSALLEDIARWGHGVFGFIPDCSMVGTVFINFLAHMLSVIVPHVELSYRIGAGHIGTVHAGPVISGQPRTIVIPISESVAAETAAAAASAGASVGTITYDGAEYAVTRSEAHDTFTDCYTDYKSLILKLLAAKGNAAIAQPLLDAFVATYRGSGEEKVTALLRDVKSDTEGEGQIGMASTSPTNYTRWGAHYMRAYLRSQELQQCMNFKDPGLQIYGGEMFHTIQTEADEIFCTLPPPKATGARESSGWGGGWGGGGAGAGAAAAPAPLTSMSVFHNASSGCFHGANRILMADGTHRRIKDVVVGDLVATPNGCARVRYTVECRQHATSQPMTQYDDLSITPWHPIRIEGEWKYPAEVAGYTSRPVNVVYNFVLDKDHIVYVGDVECCTLAHGFKGPIIEHAYFGSAVLVDLQAKAGGALSGHVVYENLKTLRDPKTDMIIGWIDAGDL
jgi:hypothetical protein